LQKTSAPKRVGNPPGLAFFFAVSRNAKADRFGGSQNRTIKESEEQERNISKDVSVKERQVRKESDAVRKNRSTSLEGVYSYGGRRKATNLSAPNGNRKKDVSKTRKKS